ncbi:kinesin family member 2/24, partial [Clonorchis sinensis]
MDILKIPAPDHIVLCEPRQRFDLTEYLEQTSFRFDHCFEEHADTAEVYQHTAAPMVKLIFQGYMATCFAYGQTGSGKTFTMGGPKSGSSRLPVVEGGIYGMVVEDLFALYEKMNYSEEYTVSVNYFEIYCNKVYDLLNQKRQLRVMEDSFGSVQLLGLREYLVKDAKTTLGLLRHGYQLRTNGQTLANEQSSRSHAIFQIASTPCTYPNPHYSGPLYGRFSLVDLAGNERSVDSASTLNRFQYLESGEINKSLLALKECIRAMGNNTTSYLPFRTSKLTQVLRESFVGKRSCTCMIATVSPGLSCCEHSMNTLRYAQRVKHLVPSSFVPKVSYYVSHLTTDTDWFQPRSRAASALSRKGSRAAGDGKHQFCRQVSNDKNQLNSAKPAKSQSDKPKTPSLSVDQPPEDRETPSYRTTRSSLKHSVRHTPRPATTPNSTSSLGSSTDSQALSDMPMTDFETVDRLTSSADTRESGTNGLAQREGFRRRHQEKHSPSGNRRKHSVLREQVLQVPGPNREFLPEDLSKSSHCNSYHVGPENAQDLLILPYLDLATKMKKPPSVKRLCCICSCTTRTCRRSPTLAGSWYTLPLNSVPELSRQLFLRANQHVNWLTREQSSLMRIGTYQSSNPSVTTVDWHVLSNLLSISEGLGHGRRQSTLVTRFILWYSLTTAHSLLYKNVILSEDRTSNRRQLPLNKVITCVSTQIYNSVIISDNRLLLFCVVGNRKRNCDSQDACLVLLYVTRLSHTNYSMSDAYSATSTPKCNTNVSARRHRFLRLQKQKHDVIKKHEELIK